MARMRYGRDPDLTAEADRLLRESMAGITRHSDKKDILTPWKQSERYRREVYVASGTPEPSVRKGIFHRSVNRARPDLNSREGLARNYRHHQGAGPDD
jgi:hypothetical protein